MPTPLEFFPYLYPPPPSGGGGWQFAPANCRGAAWLDGFFRFGGFSSTLPSGFSQEWMAFFSAVPLRPPEIRFANFHPPPQSGGGYKFIFAASRRLSRPHRRHSRVGGNPKCGRFGVVFNSISPKVNILLGFTAPPKVNILDSRLRGNGGERAGGGVFGFWRKWRKICGISKKMLEKGGRRKSAKKSQKNLGKFGILRRIM
ncbi:MAG: hypothetical protein HAW59_00815 [Betaproteobacteria bacterium]|nr:hypothetical protein [Betaproteobacteria bacterium]